MGYTYKTKFFSMKVLGLYFRGKHDLYILVHTKPWFETLWERLIGLVKTCLKKVQGQTLVTIKELSCVMIELEAIINDRFSVAILVP